MIYDHRRTTDLSGIMLVECILYIALFSVVIGSAYALFFRASDNHVGLRRNAEEIARVLHAGERWREDIRLATGPPAYAGWDARPMWCIPQRESEVYYLYDADRIWRFASSNGVPEEVVARVARSEMRQTDRAGVTAYAWTIELKTKRKTPAVRPLFHFLAVPKSERRP